MSEHQDWSQRRRVRHRAQVNIDAAMELCARHLSVGAIVDATRAAALARHLITLEALQSDRRRKQDIKAAIERRRAEAALEEARKAVASLSPSAAPTRGYNVLCSDADWPDTLQRMLADAGAPRGADNTKIDSYPVQTAPPDSC